MLKHLLKKTTFCLLFAFIATALNAQSLSRTVVCSTATTVDINGYSFTYVLGETVGDLFSSKSAGTFLTSGFSQPDATIQDILASSSYTNIDFSLFPNPVPAVSTIKLGFKSTLPEGKYTIAVIDAAGKILQTRDVYYKAAFFGYQEFIVASYAKGVYFLRILGVNNYKAALKFEKQ